MTEENQLNGWQDTGAIPQVQTLSAVTPSRLAARTPPEAVRSLSCEAWWMATQKVASDWQGMSVWADFWEVSSPRVQYGRSHDLVGCIADGGERLALALAAVTEAECGGPIVKTSHRRFAS